MSLLMRGKHFKTIGHVLGISPQAVETYVEQMKAKLSAFTRTQLLDMLDERYIPIGNQNAILNTHLASHLNFF